MAEQWVPSSGNAVDWSRVTLEQNSDPDNNITLGYTVKLASDTWAISDFSAPDVPSAQAATFLHEMTHVWQYAQWGAFLYYPRAAVERTYNYSLSSGTDFTSLGMEQQAAVIENDFRILSGLSARYSVQPTSIDVYNNVLAPVRGGD